MKRYLTILLLTVVFLPLSNLSANTGEPVDVATSQELILMPGEMPQSLIATPQVNAQPEPRATLNYGRETGVYLRTNLLYWVALAPNAGIEWKPTPGFGILVNGGWTHWSWDNANRQYRLWFFSPELRFYFGQCKKWYVGAEFHMGDYNFKFSDNGSQGSFMGGGLTVGYRLYINKVLSMDFHIGGGYTHIKDYEEYTRVNGEFVRVTDPTTKNQWFPTQAGISLVFKL